jgi:hypothetical protein
MKPPQATDGRPERRAVLGEGSQPNSVAGSREQLRPGLALGEGIQSIYTGVFQAFCLLM